MVTFGADLGDGVCPFLSFTSIESDLFTLFQDDTLCTTGLSLGVVTILTAW